MSLAQARMKWVRGEDPEVETGQAVACYWAVEICHLQSPSVVNHSQPGCSDDCTIPSSSAPSSDTAIR